MPIDLKGLLKKYKRKEEGFSLIEIMGALFALVVSFLAIQSAISSLQKMSKKVDLSVESNFYDDLAQDRVGLLLRNALFWFSQVQRSDGNWPNGVNASACEFGGALLHGRIQKTNGTYPFAVQSPVRCQPTGGIPMACSGNRIDISNTAAADFDLTLRNMGNPSTLVNSPWLENTNTTGPAGTKADLVTFYNNYKDSLNPSNGDSPAGTPKNLSIILKNLWSCFNNTIRQDDNLWGRDSFSFCLLLNEQDPQTALTALDPKNIQTRLNFQGTTNTNISTASFKFVYVNATFKDQTAENLANPNAGKLQCWQLNGNQNRSLQAAYTFHAISYEKKDNMDIKGIKDISRYRIQVINKNIFASAGNRTQINCPGGSEVTNDPAWIFQCYLQ